MTTLEKLAKAIARQAERFCKHNYYNCDECAAAASLRILKPAPRLKRAKPRADTASI